MRKLFCAAALLFAGVINPRSVLLACGDKFVSAGRSTRLQHPPAGRQESILIYANPSSDVPAAIARGSMNALQGAGYRPKIVTTRAEFERELGQENWDLLLVGLSDAEAVNQRPEKKFGILPVALKASSAELKQATKEYPVILTKVPSSDGFIRAVFEALNSKSKTLKAVKAA
jgi:hypothetical protein